MVALLEWLVELVGAFLMSWAHRKDGGLGGYRWGLRRKRALLERERAA